MNSMIMLIISKNLNNYLIYNNKHNKKDYKVKNYINKEGVFKFSEWFNK